MMYLVDSELNILEIDYDSVKEILSEYISKNKDKIIRTDGKRDFAKTLYDLIEIDKGVIFDAKSKKTNS